MKTVFDKVTRDELVSRINQLNENSKPLWGKMAVFQMLRHCAMWDAWVTGNDKKKYPRALMGYIFGRSALKNITKDETIIPKNAVSLRDFIVPQTIGDIEAEKNNWIKLIRSYAHFNNHGFVHSFFGRMTTEQVGRFAYKHTDHHLRQFGC